MIAGRDALKDLIAKGADETINEAAKKALAMIAEAEQKARDILADAVATAARKPTQEQTPRE